MNGFSRRLFGRLFCCLAVALCLTPSPSLAQRATPDSSGTPTPVPFCTRLDVQVRQAMQSPSSPSPWLAYLLTCANDPSGQVGIENVGHAATWAYLYTGNPVYAANAWSAISGYISAGTLPGGNNNNSIRIHFGLYAIGYRILHDALTPDQRAAYIAWMNGIAARARVGFFSGNANGLIGEYLGLSLWSVISAPDQPAVAVTLLAGTWKDSGVTKPYGGLDVDPSLSARGSARNAIYDYVTTSYPPGGASGSWLEGTQYVNASLEPLLLYTLALQEITGQDHFPEVTAAMPQMARNIIGLLVNSGTDEMQQGDDEFPHDLHISDTLCTATMLARRLVGTTDGARLQGLVNFWSAPKSSGGAGYGYKGYALRMYLCLDPYGAASDFRAIHPPLVGNGLSIWRSGWDNASDSVFGVNTDPATLVDHTEQDEVFRSFRLYRKGEWALDHPISYGGMGCFPDGNNTVVSGGKGVMWQHGVTAVENGAGYCYQRSETSGPPYAPGTYKPPTPYVSEQCGSVLYVHGQNKACDLVVVADRVNATAPSLSGWRPFDLSRITAAESSTFPAGPLQWTLHAPVSPLVQNGAIYWQTDGGQNVLSQELDGNSATPEIVDESAVDGSGSYLYFGYGSVLPQERAYQVRETISDGQAYHFLLHAIAVFDGAIAPAMSRIDGNGVTGALVQPAGEAATLAVFGSDPGGRQIEGSYSLSFASSAKETDVYLCDIDPSKSVQIVRDSGLPVEGSFGPGGVVRTAFFGQGKHTLTVLVN